MHPDGSWALVSAYLLGFVEALSYQRLWYTAGYFRWFFNNKPAFHNLSIGLYHMCPTFLYCNYGKQVYYVNIKENKQQCRWRQSFFLLLTCRTWRTQAFSSSILSFKQMHPIINWFSHHVHQDWYLTASGFALELSSSLKGSGTLSMGTVPIYK